MAKKAYIGVDGKARKIKKGFVGVSTEVPIYEETVKTVNITASNISEMFTVTNGTYYFKGSGGTFTTSNYGNDSTTATTTLTAKSDMTVSFNYSYSSEQGYDKFTLKVAGTTVEDAVSGSTTSKSYSGNLTAGQKIEFTYAKDGSQSKNEDKCTFSNMVVTGTVKTQVGSETKSLARKIKKAYIGIGGVARPCWSGGELAYYGTVTALRYGTQQLAATTVGNYALFGGGMTEKGTVRDSVTAYDKSLVRSAPDDFSKARADLSAASVGNYALFAGGVEQGYTHNTVDAYSASLTRSTPTAMNYANTNQATASVGNYALFCGGKDGSSYRNQIEVYNTSLTRSAAYMQASVAGLAATAVGNYAVAGGGYNRSGDSALMNAIDPNLTVTYPSALSVKRSDFAATTVGGYALFGGGSYKATVDAYDTSLTRTTPTALSAARQSLGATSVGGFAIFAGGETSSAESAVVDVYDASLTRTTGTSLNKARIEMGATTVGNYALFGGGDIGFGVETNIVDAFVVD